MPACRPVLTCLPLTALLLALGGCGSTLTEGASAGAGIAGAALANAVTRNGAVTAGIGLGAQAAASAGVQYLERRVHGEEQQAIAHVAGALPAGAVAPWSVTHGIPIEENRRGQVTVARAIGNPASGLDCKEIVFSVDGVADRRPTREFYTAAVCRNGPAWQWATAEPATERWGALQ